MEVPLMLLIHELNLFFFQLFFYFRGFSKWQIDNLPRNSSLNNVYAVYYAKLYRLYGVGCGFELQKLEKA